MAEGISRNALDQLQTAAQRLEARQQHLEYFVRRESGPEFPECGNSPESSLGNANKVASSGGQRIHASASDRGRGQGFPLAFSPEAVVVFINKILSMANQDQQPRLCPSLRSGCRALSRGGTRTWLLQERRVVKSGIRRESCKARHHGRKEKNRNRVPAPLKRLSAAERKVRRWRHHRIAIAGPCTRSNVID